MTDYKDRKRFIPLRKSEIIRLLCESGFFNSQEQDKFRMFCKILESIYHFEFYDKLENLKENYYPFNPDKDTYTVQTYSQEEINACEHNLLENFSQILNNANYEQLGEEYLSYAIEKESVFKIGLFVDFNDFDSQLIFWRGNPSRKIVMKKWFIKTVETEIAVFDRIAMFIKFKDQAYFNAKKRKNLLFEPGSMIIKLFKNIPRADLEMLFPNTQVRMKLKDKLLMTISVLGGGIGVFLKASAGLIAMASVLWFMLRSFIAGGQIPGVGPAETSQLVGGITAIGVICAFIFKQWNNYKNRKIKFMKTLGDNLYFKNLDNNAGVFHHIINDAEEEECKEAILGYYFLLQHKDGLTESALDDEIEAWFKKQHNILIDFEIKDALRKLTDLELCGITGQNEKKENIYHTISLKDACKKLDCVWDNYFGV